MKDGFIIRWRVLCRKFFKHDVSQYLILYKNATVGVDLCDKHSTLIRGWSSNDGAICLPDIKFQHLAVNGKNLFFQKRWFLLNFFFEVYTSLQAICHENIWAIAKFFVAFVQINARFVTFKFPTQNFSDIYLRKTKAKWDNYSYSSVLCYVKYYMQRTHSS